MTTDNRLDEIRAREKSMREKHFLPEDNEIRYLLSLLDARPAVARDVREIGELINEVANAAFTCGEWNDEGLEDYKALVAGLEANKSALAQRVTAYAIQRYREGAQDCLDKMEQLSADWEREGDYGIHQKYAHRIAAINEAADVIRAALLQESE